MILMNKEEVLNQLRSYTEHEIFYYEYYQAQRDPASLEVFLHKHNAQELYDKRLIVTEIEGSWNPVYMSETNMMKEELIKDIAIIKHNRYTPVFEHEHSFFEMVYVVEGRCTEVIESREITLQEGQI